MANLSQEQARNVELCPNCGAHLKPVEAENERRGEALKEIADGDPIYWTFERARLVARKALVGDAV